MRTDEAEAEAKETIKAALLTAAVPLALVLAVMPGWYDLALAKWIVLYALAVPASVYVLSQKALDLKDALVGVFVGYLALSILWAPDWRQGVIDLQHFGTLAVLFLAMRRLGPLCLWPAVFIAAVFPQLFGNENVAASFLIVAIPLMFAWPRWGAAEMTAVVVGVAALLFFLDSFYGWFALAFVVLGLIWRISRSASILLGFAGVLLALSILPGHPTAMASAMTRLQLFLGTAAMWADAPLLGHGLGSFDYLWPNYQYADAQLLPGFNYIGIADSYVHPGFAHNDALQMLAEAGIVGLGLFVAAIATGFRANWPAGLALAGFLLVSLIDFPLHNPETAFLGVAALASVSPVAEKTFRFPNFAAVAGFPALLAVIFSLTLGIRMGVAENLYRITHQSWASDPQTAFLAALAAHRQSDYPKHVRLELFRSMTRAFIANSVVISREAADRMYATARTAIPDSPGLLLVRLYFLLLADECGEECGEIRAKLSRQSGRLWDVKRTEEMLNGPLPAAG